MHGTIKAICVGPVAGGPMQEVAEVEAVAGQGLKGNRYTTGEGVSTRANKAFAKLPR